MIDDAGCDWSMSHPTTGDNLKVFNTNIMMFLPKMYHHKQIFDLLILKLKEVKVF